MKKVIGFLVVAMCVLFVSGASATILEVGSGYTYANPQAAWDAANNGDTILIHEGTYAPSWGDYSIYSRGVSATKDLQNVTVQAAGDGKAILQGVVGIFGSNTGTTGNITIEGLYINPEGVTNKTGLYVRADAGYNLGPVTARNNVIYGVINQGIYTYGAIASFKGPLTFEHNTVYNGNQNGYGIREWINGSKTTIKPIFNSNIAVGFSNGMQTWYGGFDKFNYSNSYDNPGGNYIPSSYKGTGSFELDPLFASIDPADDYFLYLTPSSPVEIRTGAHDGTYMGALPVIPEPATLSILSLGALLALRRKKA
jgi:hypothetical protein